MLRQVHTCRRRAGGFSLVELMMVVGIIGILLAIALPSYSAYQVRAKRAGAKAVLLEIVNRQERYAAVNRAYVPALDSAAVESGLNFTIPSDIRTVYGFSIVLQNVAGGTNNGFVATAEPVAGSSQEADGSLSINQFGLGMPIAKW